MTITLQGILLCGLHVYIILYNLKKKKYILTSGEHHPVRTFRVFCLVNKNAPEWFQFKRLLTDSFVIIPNIYMNISGSKLV